MKPDTSVTGTTNTKGRVRWRERQVLRWHDLAAEQDHRIAQRRRHDRSAHDWGIVRGLELTGGADAFLVQPGIAVDGYGRLIVVDAPIVLPVAAVDQISTQVDAEAVDVWLLYGVAAAPSHGRGRTGHATDCDSRWLEQPRVRLLAVCDVDDAVHARCPPGVASSDVPFGPERTSPDTPEAEWPVYLGRLRHDAGAQIGVDGRPYAGLTGAAVISPGRDGRMDVGSERPGDPQRFVVATGQPPDDRLTIDRQGHIEVGGATAVHGDLRMRPSTADGASALQVQPLATAPETAAPWQLYAVSLDEPAIDEVRIEIGNPGEPGDVERYRFAVGVQSEQTDSFSPCLTVNAGCTVTIHGELNPRQLVILAPAEADSSDPRVVNALLTDWLRALAGAGGKLDELYSGALRAEIEDLPEDSVPDGTPIEYSVSITNRGPVTIRDVTAVELFAVNDVTEGEPTQIDGVFALPPSDECTFDRSTTAQAGTYSILVAAAGRGPGDYPVLAMARANVIVTGGA